MPVSSAHHPDPDTVAAFCAHALDARERTSVFEHLAGCASCREWIALAGGPEHPEPRTSAHGSKISIPLAAAVACVLASAWFVAFHARPRRAPAVASYVQTDTVVAESAGSMRLTGVRVRPHAERTVHLPATLTPMVRETSARNTELPLAWQRIRLASASRAAPAPNQFSLTTIVGEKWITLDGLWESGTGVQ